MKNICVLDYQLRESRQGVIQDGEKLGASNGRRSSRLRATTQFLSDFEALARTTLSIQCSVMK